MPSFNLLMLLPILLACITVLSSLYAALMTISITRGITIQTTMRATIPILGGQVIPVSRQLDGTRVANVRTQVAKLLCLVDHNLNNV